LHKVLKIYQFTIHLITYHCAELLFTVDSAIKHIKQIGHGTLCLQQSSTCSDNLTVIKEICSMLGIPLAIKKVEGPSDYLIFLGTTLDTQSMQACLPEDKLKQIHC